MGPLEPVPKRYLSLEEARATLPGVQRHLLRLQELHRDLGVLRGLAFEFPDPWENHAAQVRASREMHRKAAEYYGELEAILELGAMVKDIPRGLIDFYSLDGGQEVLLCWMQGEEDIGFFHDLERGFAGRQPVSLLKGDFLPRRRENE
ncbi:MAG: DUF2203 domain-containing protein [Euryarchaeota archaeon]|nr:DUF2203 domain-containing protein [Euryarchaeota archaeon]